VTINIRELLHRRTDLSTFVVHLTRDSEVDAKQALMSIASKGLLMAKRPMGWAASQDDPTDINRQTQRVVCFSETPLEHVDTLVADIAGRDIHLAPWGLVLTKMTARGAGVNPVWYVDMTPGRDWEIAKALDLLRAEAVAAGFHTHPAAQLFPFFEQMGTWPSIPRQKEFWWEREWRKRGPMNFKPENVVAWIVPSAEQPEFIAFFKKAWPWSPVRCIDAGWSLEAIIAHLTDQSPITPFD
jgi:hypothetical protein